jgi:hypothetical protein
MTTRLDALMGEGPLADSPPSVSASASALGSSAGEPAAQEFDYVIVGGGPAGLRGSWSPHGLSGDERVRVGVLEAGGYVAPGEELRINLIVN